MALGNMNIGFEIVFITFKPKNVLTPPPPQILTKL